MPARIAAPTRAGSAPRPAPPPRRASTCFAPSVSGRRVSPWRSRGPPEQPERPEGQYGDHQDELREDAVVTEVRRAEVQVDGRVVLHQPEQHGADRGPGKTAHPSDDHHDERSEKAP